MKQPFHLLAFLALVAVLALGATGCQSFNAAPPPGAQASITITNRPKADVMRAARDVFNSYGFEGGETGAGQLTYTRSGTRSSNLAYSSDMYTEMVMIRVVVTVTELDATSTKVSCKAWLAESADDPFYEDNHKVRPLNKWPYQQLLKDIAAQLGQ